MISKCIIHFYRTQCLAVKLAMGNIYLPSTYSIIQTGSTKIIIIMHNKIRKKKQYLIYLITYLNCMSS